MFSTFNAVKASDPTYLIKKIGKTGSGDGEFYYSYSIINAKGMYYVADFGNDRIEVFNQNWIFQYSFGTSGLGVGQLDGPYSLYYNGTYIFVTEYVNSRVSVFDTDGHYKTTFGTKGTGLGQLYNPAVITAYDGLIYIADHGNGRIQVYNESTFDFVRTISNSHTTSPFGIAIKDDIIYICDVNSENVIMLDVKNGFYLNNAVNYPSGEKGHTPSPFIDTIINNYLVVTDAFSQSINIYDNTGVMVDQITGGMNIPGNIIIKGDQIIVNQLGLDDVWVMRAVANPSNLNVITGDYGNLITWNIDQSQGALSILKYNIYRDNGSGSEFIGQTTSQSFSDISAKPGQTYTYSVEAVSSIATSNRITSAKVNMGSPNNVVQKITQTVTVAGGSNDTTSTGGSFLSNLPVELGPVVFALVMIPIVLRKKNLFK